MMHNPNTMPYDYTRGVIDPVIGDRAADDRTRDENTGLPLVRDDGIVSAMLPPAPAPYVPSVGDRVRILPGAHRAGGGAASTLPRWAGERTVVTVTEPVDADGDVRVTDGTSFGSWVLPKFLAPVTVADDPISADTPDVQDDNLITINADALRADVERLTRERDAYQADARAFETRWHSAMREHREDVQTIGETLISEANDRGWCDVFDAVVSELNGSLHVELPTRARVWSFTVVLEDEDGEEVRSETFQTQNEYANEDDAWREIRSQVTSGSFAY